MSEEQLQIFNLLWSEERPSFQGNHYRFPAVAVNPRPVQQPRFPIWVGGESKPARRRAGRYGNAWFSYFVRTTPEELSGRFQEVRQFAAEAGRDPDEVSLCCCRPVEVTAEPVQQEPDNLRGTPEQLVEAIKQYEAAGVEHMALQFMKGRWPERREQIQRFGEEAIPALRS